MTTTTMNASSDRACLVVQGMNQPGIGQAIMTTLYKHGANTYSSDQFVNEEDGAYFQRTMFQLPGFAAHHGLNRDLAQSLGEEFDLDWKVSDLSRHKRVVIFASKSDHCLLDLLWRHRRGELPVSVPMVISNHPDMADDVRSFGIPYFHIPTKGEDKSQVEAKQLELLVGNVDLIVLARYMQVLSPDFLESVGAPIINIHHSFLPAFIGAAPYRKAAERGVKLIGATAHYVTDDLDEGPIIEQDVVRVSHRETMTDLARRGADVERQVLSRAVLWHVQDKILRDGHHTVILH